MKNLIIIVILLVCSISTSFGQLTIDNFYENKDEFLIYSNISDCDSITKEVIISSVKNWGGTKFNNFSNVLVQETNNQLVFNYITNDFYVNTAIFGKNILRWYIRMVVQAKDNKIKISLYDDGNAYEMQYTRVRSVMFNAYFYDSGLANKASTDGLNNVKRTCILTVIELIESVKSGNEINNNW